MSAEEFNQINEYLNSGVDITKWPLEDQLTLVSAQMEMVEKIKPVIVKHIMEDNTPSTFIFKL